MIRMKRIIPSMTLAPSMPGRIDHAVPSIAAEHTRAARKMRLARFTPGHLPRLSRRNAISVAAAGGAYDALRGPCRRVAAVTRARCESSRLADQKLQSSAQLPVGALPVISM